MCWRKIEFKIKFLYNNKKIKKYNDYIFDNKMDLERIVKDFKPYVITIIDNAVNDRLSYEDKEEIITDTFFILWKNRNKVKTSLSSYIAGITRNLIKKKLSKNRITYNIDDYENIIETSGINFFDTERSEISRIEKSLNNLNELDLNIVKLFYYSSKSIKDIANELELSEMNVKTKLFRIRKKIKKELGVGD